MSYSFVDSIEVRTQRRTVSQHCEVSFQFDVLIITLVRTPSSQRDANGDSAIEVNTPHFMVPDTTLFCLQAFAIRPDQSTPHPLATVPNIPTGTSQVLKAQMGVEVRLHTSLTQAIDGV
jgi:hypothetical protein